MAMKRYLVTVRLNDRATVDDIQECVPKILSAAKSAAVESPEVAFRSFDSSLFGILIYSDRPLGVINSAFDTSTGLTRDDSYWILEVGPDTCASQGLTRPMTWVQRHQSP